MGWIDLLICWLLNICGNEFLTAKLKKVVGLYVQQAMRTLKLDYSPFCDSLSPFLHKMTSLWHFDRRWAIADDPM